MAVCRMEGRGREWGPAEQLGVLQPPGMSRCSYKMCWTQGLHWRRQRPAQEDLGREQVKDNPWSWSSTARRSVLLLLLGMGAAEG